MDVEFTNALFGFVWQAGQDGPDDGGHKTPGDRGGFTRLGITEQTWLAWQTSNNHAFEPITAAPLSELAALYYAQYWKPITYNTNPSIGLRLSLFDFGITAGCGRSIKLLQALLGFTGKDLDGMMGPFTATRASARDQTILIDQLSQAQEDYYKSLSDFHLFGNGWLARTRRRRITAQGLNKQINSLYSVVRSSQIYADYLAENP